ncbi:MAG: HNH endonuclease [Clostridia bacterium]|nr:HNH endonuclease [Clostridia bacterium]
MKEIWKSIENYPYYQISNFGRVRSLDKYVKHYKSRCGFALRKGMILKTKYDKDSYYTICLRNNGIAKTLKVHRLVAQAFIPNPNKLPIVNHKDENKSNNFVWINDDGSVDLEKSNLEWCTQEYNNNYNFRQQRISRETIKKKLSKPILQYDMKGNFLKEWPSGIEIQRQLGFSQANISRCCLGKSNYAYLYKWKYKETA